MADEAPVVVPVEEEEDTRPELTVLVLLRDQLQKLRIAESNRAGAALRMEEEDRAALHHTYAERIEALEKDIERAIKREMHNHPAWPWLAEIHGVGETSAALVVGLIDIERSPTVSALWRFAGYGVKDGKRERPIKGEKLHYHSRLKTMVWRLIDLQVKLRGPFRAIYDDAKHGYITTRMEPAKARAALTKMKLDPDAVVEIEPEEGAEDTVYWTLGHCEAAARRKAAKVFLSMLWKVWREAEGLPTPDLYIQAHGAFPTGHTILDPHEFVGQRRKK